ncbi:hypothetical protein FACS1894201_07990 [Bacteroidia bacterium]|nr:hypothetical protein FACS1894201_07990 [Bacteroidia bacterium]
MDAALEHDKGAKKIGSTLKGIGPAYTDKIARHGLRVDDIFSPNFTEKYQHLKQMHVQQMNSLGFDYQNHSIDGMPFADYEQQWIKSLEFVKQFDIIPCEYYLNEALNAGKRVLAEGAQGTLLDVDFGSYPFVTSSNTTVAGVCAGLGVAPSRIGKVYGIFKAYCTRVGNGPFPSELNDTIGDQLRKQGHEFGATTGRPRRCGWLDIPALQYAVMLNGVTELIVTKIDVMDNFSTIHICEHYMLNGKPTNQFPMTEDFPLVTPIYKSFKGWQQPLNVASAYEQLPQALQDYVQYVESQMGIRVSMVSVGPDRVQTIYR